MFSCRFFAGLGLAAGLSLASAPALAEDLVFMLDNRTSFELVQFFASPTDVDDWEDDILGVDVLSAGEGVRITIADGREQCDYDLRMVFDDGDVMEESANLCETGSYTITE